MHIFTLLFANSAITAALDITDARIARAI